MSRCRGPTPFPVLVGASCFVAGGAVYLLSPSVVVFGTLAILFAYLVFDILESAAWDADLPLVLQPGVPVPPRHIPLRGAHRRDVPIAVADLRGGLPRGCSVYLLDSRPDRPPRQRVRRREGTEAGAQVAVGTASGARFGSGTRRDPELAP